MKLIFYDISVILFQTQGRIAELIGYYAAVNIKLRLKSLALPIDKLQKRILNRSGLILNLNTNFVFEFNLYNKNPVTLHTAH